MSDRSDNSYKFWQELKRRKVIRVAITYIIVGFGVIEAADIIIPNLHLPQWIISMIVLITLAGFPITMILSWIFDVTSEGLRKTKSANNRKLNLFRWTFAVIVVTITAVAAGLSWQFWLRPQNVTDKVKQNIQEVYNPSNIAVLYFDDHSAENNLEYLVNGLTEELIHELSQIKALHVISRNGVKPFRNGEYTIDSISDLLKVGTIVEGSLQKSGEKIRLTFQLIDANTGEHLDSRVLNRLWGELFELQDDLAREVTEFLRERLGVEIELIQKRARANSQDAWELYRRADKLIEEVKDRGKLKKNPIFTKSLKIADSLLICAGELDPDWIEIPVLQGWLYIHIASLGQDKLNSYDLKSLNRSLEYANHALRIDKNDPEALELKGVILHFLASNQDSEEKDKLYREAESNLKLAVSINPLKARAWCELSDMYRKDGNFIEAKNAALKAMEADEFLTNSLHVIFWLATILIELQQFDDAQYWIEKGEKRFPHEPCFPSLELTMLALSDGPDPVLEDSWEIYYRICKLISSDGYSQSLYDMSAILGRLDMIDSAYAVIKLAKKFSTGDPWELYAEASALIIMNNYEKALDLLEQFLAEMPDRKEYIKNDQSFQALRNHPKFISLLSED